MQDQDKTKERLIGELERLRDRVSKQEDLEARLRQTERLLIESEERFRLLYENAPLAYQSLDENGYFLEVNQAWLDVLGYSRHEVIGKWCGDFLTASYREKFTNDFPRFKDAGEIHGIEFAMLKKDGSTIFVTVDGKIGRDMHGQFKQTHCILHDITERKKAEESLDRANQEWERTFDAISDLVMVLDSQHKILRANRTMADSLGMTEQELIGSLCFELVHGNKEPPASCPHSQLLTDGQEHSAEVVEPLLGGTYDVRVSPLIDQKGQVIGSVHVARDITESKRAEVELRKSNDLLRAIIEAAPTAIIGLDLQGNVQMVWNPAAEKMLGWSAEEAMGRPLPSVPPESQEEFRRFRERIRSGKTMDGVEVRRQRRDGNPIDYSIYASPLHDARGQITGNVAVLVDVTEHKRAEDNLRRSEAKFLDLYENAPCAYLSLGTDSIIRLCNRRAEELLGYSREELIGMPVFELYSDNPEGKEKARTVFRRFLTGEPVADEELQMQKKHGSPVWISLTVNGIRDSNGHLVESRSMVLDISDRKRAEEALRESEAFYRSLYENISDCIFIIDVTPGGRFKFVSLNPAEERAVGMTTEQVANRFTEDVVSRDVAEQINSRYQMCVDKRQTIHYEEVLDLPKGKMSFLTSLVPIEGPDGRIYRIIGVARDITEQKSLQRQLLQAQKMEAIGTLAGGIAHDFNNILQIVLGFSEILLIGRSEGNKQRQNIQNILSASRKGAELVKGLLALGRKGEINPRPVNLNHVIHQTEAILARTMPKTIKVESILQQQLSAISADPVQMEQILLNIAVNARDAMPEGGTLTFETSNVSLDEKYSGGHIGTQPGNYVLLTVSDTGEGMTKQTLEHVFEPFFSTKADGEGTGLGLAMVYGIVKQHSGHITCYSEPGVGTTFKLYFPIIAMAEETRSREEIVRLPEGTETVLLVDDEDLVRELAATILSQAGYLVLSAANGREALQVYKKERKRISLVILDLIMPDMDGKQCLRGLLKINPAIRVVVASGYSANGPTKKALESGAKGFVSKPFDMRQLLQTVRKVLDES